MIDILIVSKLAVLLAIILILYILIIRKVGPRICTISGGSGNTLRDIKITSYKEKSMMLFVSFVTSILIAYLSFIIFSISTCAIQAITDTSYFLGAVGSFLILSQAMYSTTSTYHDIVTRTADVKEKKRIGKIHFITLVTGGMLLSYGVILFYFLR